MTDIFIPDTIYGAKVKVLKEDFKRTQGKVLLQLTKHGTKAYEVHIIRAYKGLFDLEPRYQLATPEDFGTYAWYYKDKKEALKRFNEL